MTNSARYVETTSRPGVLTLQEGFNRAVLYRRVYGKILDRLDRVVDPESPEQLRNDPLQGLAPLDPAVAQDPETAEAIRDAVEDALSGRRPRW